MRGHLVQLEVIADTLLREQLDDGLALDFIGVEQGLLRAPFEDRRQLPCDVLGVLHATVEAKTSGVRKPVCGIAGEQGSALAITARLLGGHAPVALRPDLEGGLVADDRGNDAFPVGSGITDHLLLPADEWAHQDVMVIGMLDQHAAEVGVVDPGQQRIGLGQDRIQLGTEEHTGHVRQDGPLQCQAERLADGAVGTVRTHQPVGFDAGCRAILVVDPQGHAGSVRGDRPHGRTLDERDERFFLHP